MPEFKVRERRAEIALRRGPQTVVFELNDPMREVAFSNRDQREH